MVPVADSAAWRTLLVRAGPVALEQGWSYGEAMRVGHRQTVERLAFGPEGAPCALLQSFRRRVLGFGELTRIVRGPAWIGTPDTDTRIAVLRAIATRYGRGLRQVLLWMPELGCGPAEHDLMRAAGLRRVVTGYSSAWLDLAPEAPALRAGLDGNWRNALNAAERAGLSVDVCRGDTAIGRQVAAYDRFRRSRRFIGPPGKFVRALIDSTEAGDDALVLGASAGGPAVAGIVLLRHGAAATYHAGWTSDDGRRSNAHNLLLWRGVLRLRNAGTRWLDLGGISAAAPGVARFKLGVGGSFFTLAGTYM